VAVCFTAAELAITFHILPLENSAPHVLALLCGFVFSVT